MNKGRFYSRILLWIAIACLGFLHTAAFAQMGCDGLIIGPAGPRLDTSFGEPANPNLSIRIRGRVTEVASPNRVMITLNTKNNEWFSFLTDIQGEGLFIRRGNPLWAISWVGEKAASVFGFERRGPRSLLAPTAEYVNQAIEKSNSATNLPNLKIGIRYYTPGVDRVPEQFYIDKFINEGALPIASKGSEYLHDINYHLMSVLFMPDRVIAHMRRTYKMQFDFRTYLAEFNPELAGKIYEAYPTQAEYEGISLRLDSITSELLVKDEQFRYDQEVTSADPFPSWKAFLGGDALSPAEAFAEVWSDRLAYDAAKLNKFNETTRAEVMETVRAYAKSMESADPNLAKKLVLDDQLRREIDQRISGLRSVWESISRD